MELETKDYKGDCRRNGGKLRLSGLDWFRIGKWGIGLIILATAGWITLKMNVGALADDVKEEKAKNIQQDEVNRKQNKAIYDMQSDIKYTREDIRDMKQEQTIMNKSISGVANDLSEIKGWIKAKVNEESHLRIDSYAGDRPIIRRIE